MVLGSNPPSRHEEFTCSPHVCVGSLRYLERTHGRLSLYVRLATKPFFLFFCDMVWHRGIRGDHGKCLPEYMWPHIWACGPHQRWCYGFKQSFPVSTGTLMTSDSKDHNLIHVKFTNNVYLHFYSEFLYHLFSSASLAQCLGLEQWWETGSMSGHVTITGL